MSRLCLDEAVLHGGASAASESAVLVQVGPVCVGEVGGLVWLAV